MTLLQQATVLITEAAPHQTEALAQMLVAASYQVQVRAEADLLPQISPQTPQLEPWPDLIILQVAGADSSGYHLGQKLKANPSTAVIPLIFAGSFKDTASRERVFAAGGVDYLESPFLTADVSARVGHWLEVATAKPIRPSLLKDSLQRLHNTLDLDTILQTAVQDVRQQILADRVIIYQFGQNGRGMVTHEAVVDERLTVLRRQVEDACFDQEHATKYWSGRVGQINDVKALGNISQCYRDMLLSFGIQANLVAPIIHTLPGQNRYLWGLIIVHQCYQPRRWQTHEIELLQEISAHLAIAIQQSRLFEQVRHQARQEMLLNHILDEIRASLDVQHILTCTVEHLGTALNLRQCGITLLRHNLTSLPTPFVVTVQAPALSEPIAPLEITETLRQQLMLDNNLIVLPYRVNPLQMRPNAAQLVAQGENTYLATAIRIDNQVQGVLWACPAPSRLASIDKMSLWEHSDLSLVEEVAMQLSQALQQAALYQQLQAANDELRRLAHLDGLTQIANRREFDRYLAQEWQRLQREQGSLALVLADVDHFKGYNDTYGHLAGDDCLRSIARLLAQVTKRPADLAARYGGEEFALVLPNTTAAGAISLTAEAQTYLTRLAIPNAASPLYGQVTVSFGIAVLTPAPALSTELLIQRADQALYAAKESGRNSYCLWSEGIQST
ncbi:diguanylate cyclase [Nodosilinea sp. LEGE 06152]|uniref:diguanylate cyclase domain-containing protein n=1 Tax=Nodosilinea sp. LEGE 06152 TaxID=2777966 RepID=UPI00188062D9|nr:diguanylate cyclase [Nodosilinea sp. LEGE 06152]MBE9158392.1 diguanylate cyclase [Nodosilinea sp. LEGE 06152]